MKSLKVVMFALASMPLVAGAQITYNNSINPLIGSGNTSGGWASATGDGVTLSLRAQSTIPGPGDLTPNVDGVYSFATSTAAYATWDYWFDVNPGTTTGLTYVLTGYSSLNSTPVSLAITSTTLGGTGVNGTEFQNSENISFTGGSGETDATYYFTLQALEGTTVEDSVNITVENGVSAVPEPSTYFAAGVPVLMLGLGALKGLRKKQA